MMKRIFSLMLGALALVAVALISAFIAMRLAIHGREAVVPQLTGLTVSEASITAAHQRLHLTLENRFYSADIPAGHILAQDPASGSHVRREWPVRITESLGPQRVTIPDLSGESERVATISVRRLSLDLGVIAHLAVPGIPDVVLTQTPPANSGGVDGPRISLLVSEPEDPAQHAYVMPSLIGLNYNAASARAATAGLRIVVAADNPPSAASPGEPTRDGSLSATPAPSNPSAFPAAVQQSDIVLGQTPQPGRRVVQGDAVHITLRHSATPSPSPNSSQ